MTAQIPDRLSHRGENRSLFMLPLESYLAIGNNRAILANIHRHTACFRGYSAAWSIREGKLYFVGISGYWNANLEMTPKKRFLPLGQELTLQHLFPNAEKSIFADWFSGQLRCPMGKMLRRVHMDFASLYERDLLIEIKNGNVISESEKNNLVSMVIDENEIDIPSFLRMSE
jgi:hypothetical protein